ncbi:hypothetical protein B0H16DRAFT_1481050 [Mycena metata]|uniref:Uncharacterized protein n=1 Tax=Mycena metata TaxID=1033252 RepID=A0AAD7H0N9_9AGAR|nr:hypothetical protein B0H16DRAFT_1481050 [Mycena metata]
MIWGRFDLSFPLQRENTQFCRFLPTRACTRVAYHAGCLETFQMLGMSLILAIALLFKLMSRKSRPTVSPLSTGTCGGPKTLKAVCFDNSFSGNCHSRSIIANLALIFQEPTYATGAAVPGSVNNRRVNNRRVLYPSRALFFLISVLPRRLLSHLMGTHVSTRQSVEQRRPDTRCHFDYLPVVVPMP